MGTVNTLSAAFATPSVKAVGVITTDKVYRNDNSCRSFKESDALAGKDPYSASKVGAESAVSAWQQISKISGGPHVVAFRAGNVIGGGDWAEDRLIPDLVKAFSANQKITLRNPNSTRPWQHVLDPLAGYLAAIEKMLSGVHIEAMNFGPDSRSLSVERIAEVSAQVWPNDVSIDSSRGNELGSAEAQSLDLDSRLAREILGWSPYWSQEEAVVSSIKWWDKVINQQVSPQVACSTDIDLLLARNIQV
jgi:CDP-glucose 4,6-dehydratase